MPKPERRSTARLPVRLRVDCKPLSSSEVQAILQGRGYEELGLSSLALSRPRQGMMPARIRDLSQGGLCMEGPLALGTGEAAALDVHLPDEPVALKALAEVVWSKPAQGDQGLHACGLRFAALGQAGARRLQRFLESAALVN